MTTENPANGSLSQQFAHAWADLDLRLTNAVSTLEALAENATATGDVEAQKRLTRKVLGLHTARYNYDVCERDHFPNPRSLSDGGWHAWAWRTFTAMTLTTYRTALAEGSTDMAEGLALALEYQRGYGSDVDAPPLHILTGLSIVR